MARETETALSAALICPNPTILSTFQAVCASVREMGEVTELRAYPAAAELERVVRDGRIEAVFIDVGIDRAAALEIITAIGRFGPEIAIAGLDHSNHPEAILQCLRGGAAEFLASPFPVEEVRHAVRRMLEHSGAASHRPATSRGKVHIFAPVKGGSGATTIAYSSAYQIRKQTGGRVLLADLHLVGGVIAFLAKLRPAYSAIDALKHANRLDEGVWASLISKKNDVDILAAPDRPEPALIEAYPVQELLEFARGIYDHVVVDLGGVMDPVGMTAVSAASEVNLVCSTDMTSLFLMRRTVPVLEELGRRRDLINILVNRTDRKRQLSPAELEKIFRASIHCMFPDDPLAVQKAQRDGEALPETSELGKSIRAYVKGLLGPQIASEDGGRLGALKQLWGGA